jgi:hypothetical protein
LSPVSEPLALGPLLITLLVLGAFLSLSHVDSHDLTSSLSESHASGESGVTSYVLSAHSVSISPSSEDSGTVHVESSGSDASGESSSSLLVLSALSSISRELSENLDGGSSSNASGPLSGSLFVNSALGTSLVFEFSHD